MTRILPFGCVVLFCCILTVALKCRVCRVISGCVTGERGSCEPLPGEQCLVEKVTKEGTAKFLTRGCTLPGDKCNNTREDPYFGAIKRDCCTNRDFCND